MSFQLHPRLHADSFVVAELELSRLLLMNDARYPWLILVPRIEQAVEIHHLPEKDQQQLWRESAHVAGIMERLFQPEKMNLGALGNLVPQLHIHHIARFVGDPAWPGPVWGHSAATLYSESAAAERIALIRRALDQ